ncbi:MAG: lipoyl synthase, partial [Firmicutes bacterium]|nr:lipoyl synthase [Bacillota bacterium]
MFDEFVFWVKIKKSVNMPKIKEILVADLGLQREQSKLCHYYLKDRRMKMKPEWLKIKPPEGDEYEKVKTVINKYGLKTICQSAHCPNIPECWEKLSSTFMILGDICTRNCSFCAVKKGKPLQPDKGEPKKIASAVSELGLDYIVITSVDRDDLPDGGAGHYAGCISQIKAANPSAVVEVLIPDFAGK